MALLIIGARSERDLTAAFETAVASGMRWAMLAARCAPYPYPATRAVDASWVANQLAKHKAYVRALAESLGIDPDEAEQAWRAGRFNQLPGMKP